MQYTPVRSSPEWVRVLTEECRELRESNFQLRLEADRLRKETADIEQKERDLVQQCLVSLVQQCLVSLV